MVMPWTESLLYGCLINAGQGRGFTEVTLGQEDIILLVFIHEFIGLHRCMQISCTLCIWSVLNITRPKSKIFPNKRWWSVFEGLSLLPLLQTLDFCFVCSLLLLFYSELLPQDARMAALTLNILIAPWWQAVSLRSAAAEYSSGTQLKHQYCSWLCLFNCGKPKSWLWLIIITLLHLAIIIIIIIIVIIIIFLKKCF